jgi:seryl-tRNA synthetase
MSHCMSILLQHLGKYGILVAMLSIDFIRQHPDIVQESLRKRRDPLSVEDILRLAEQRRGLSARCDGLYSALKPLKDAVRAAPLERREQLNMQIKALTRDIRQVELLIADAETRLQPLLLRVPNIPHESVHDGGTEAVDRELSRWGDPPPFAFDPRPHWELGERLKLFDFAAGAKVAGSRFVTLIGMGARLERALISFMLDLHTSEHGYAEILPPFLAKRSIMIGAGQLPKFEDQVYVCTEDDLFLNPTAEVPLVGLHSDSILPPDTLPLRYVAWTTAFRRESIGTSRYTRGLLRLHEFNKIELFQIVEPRDSYQALDAMLGHAEAVLQSLDLPYRVVALCAQNLPFASAKTFDLEVWMPGVNDYVEISSASNCEAFQARRAEIKYRPTSAAHVDYPHTLNASGLAVGRTMAAILETYQQADGSVVIPKALRPYMGTALLEP